MSGYFEGETITMSVEFKDSAGALADPTAVMLTVKAPGLAKVEYSGAQITKDAVGKYHRDIEITVPGEWNWRWRGTGAVNAVDQGSFSATPDNT